MPFKVTDNATGKVISFQNKPTEQDLQEAFGSIAPQPSKVTTEQPDYQTQLKGQIKSELMGTPAGIESVISQVRRPVLETTGMAAGELAGAVGGPAGIATGGAIGYATGKRIADIVEEKYVPFAKTFTEFGKDIKTGAEMEMVGGIIGKTVSIGLKYAGKAGKELLGVTTGAGKGTVEEALKGKPEFTKAMRGEISGQEVVSNVKDALQTLKTQRANNYQADLVEVAKVKGNIDTKPIADTFGQLMKKYNIKITPEGKIDTSRIAMGKAGRNDIKDIVARIMEHGSKEGDNSVVGLDILKRQLDDFYSDSSQARGFVSVLKKAVSDTINKSVPKYGEMTKKYSEASNLIKDIESGLMLKKTGLSGQVTADATLRRLTSSMRENFELRKELVDILGERAGEDLAAQIAGYNASQILPRGLMGKIGGLSSGYMIFQLNPKFWPILAAGSPRLVGEFLNVYGKGIQEISKVAPALYKGAGYKVGQQMNQDLTQQQPEGSQSTLGGR